jgi:large subunit ribosomal protein L5
MSQQTENSMKKIFLAKVVLNMGVGKSGEPIEIGKKTLTQITGKKPNTRNAKKSQRDWGVRKGEPIGVAITVRNNDATELLKRLLIAKDNKISGRAIDNEGNVSFGIKEHIDIPEIKYDPKIGILGLEVSLSLSRPGFSIKTRSNQKSKIGKTHRIAKNDTIKFLTEEFGVQIV